MPRVHFHVWVSRLKSEDFPKISHQSVYVGDDPLKAINVCESYEEPGIYQEAHIETWVDGKLLDDKFVYIEGNLRRAMKYPSGVEVDFIHNDLLDKHPELITADYKKADNVYIFYPMRDFSRPKRRQI